MTPILLKTIGFVLIGMSLLGLVSGKVIAGSKGLRSNYYVRKEQPGLYYLFITIYLAIGLFIVWH